MENSQNKQAVILVWGLDLNRKKVLRGAIGLRFSNVETSPCNEISTVSQRQYSKFQNPLIRQDLPELKPEMTDSEWEAFGIEVKKVIDDDKEK